MSVAYGKGPRGKATKLHAELVRSRGYCQNCGSPGPLECAHIISRRYASTRTDENNAFCLCSSCHRRFSEWHDEWMNFVAAQIGLAEYFRLKRKALEIKKVDWDAEVVRLKALIEGALA